MKNETPNSKLVISLDELQRILDYAKNRKEHGYMKGTLEVECQNGKITITQHSVYAECNSIYHVR